jgi:hypothetical protein
LLLLEALVRGSTTPSLAVAGVSHDGVSIGGGRGGEEDVVGLDSTVDPSLESSSSSPRLGKQRRKSSRSYTERVACYHGSTSGAQSDTCPLPRHPCPSH